MNKVLPFLLLLFVFTSCSRKYKIEGASSVTSLDGKMLFIKVLQNGEWLNIDSAEVIHGLFSMKGKVDSVVMATLYIGDESIMPLVIEKGNIQVSITNTELVAKGTSLNNALYAFIDKKNSLDIQIEELQRKEARMVMDGADLADIHEQLTHEGDSLMQDMNGFIKKFISDNYETVLGPSVFMMLCSTLPYPVMTPQIEDIMKDAPYSFKDKYFGSVKGYGKILINWIADHLKPMIDENFPTLPERKFTGLGGSSMGGLMSVYGTAIRSDIFSMGACLSPFYEHIFKKLVEELSKAEVNPETKFYISWGRYEVHSKKQLAVESEKNLIISRILTFKGVQVFPHLMVEGGHNEASWEKENLIWMTELGFIK